MSTVYFAVPEEAWQYNEAMLEESSAQHEASAPDTAPLESESRETDARIIEQYTDTASTADEYAGKELAEEIEQLYPGEEEQPSPPDTSGFWLMFLLFPLMFLGFPLWEYLKAKFIISNTRYGATKFEFDANAKSFYGLYLKASGVFILAMIILGGAFGALGYFVQGQAEGEVMQSTPFILMQIGAFLFYLWAFAYVQTKKANLILSNTLIRTMPLESTLSVTYMFYLYITNTLAIVLSLGLLIPWAMVRNARYRAEQLALYADQSLDNFAAQQQEELSAIGEEFGEVFDIEVGI